MIDTSQKIQFVRAVGKFFYDKSFDEESMEEMILADMPELEQFEQKKRRLKLRRDIEEVDPILYPTYETPLLNDEQEFHLFRKLNFLKYKVTEEILCGRFKNFEKQKTEIDVLTNLLATANFRLAVGVMKNTDFGNRYDNFQNGFMLIYNCVSLFDFRRGFQFSTYCTTALKRFRYKSFINAKKAASRCEYCDPIKLDIAVDKNTSISEKKIRQLSKIVERLLQKTTYREREILERRFGLPMIYKNGKLVPSKVEPLKEIAIDKGISKQRISQIEDDGLTTLKEVAEYLQIVIPD